VTSTPWWRREPRAGALLVATPELRDPNFRRTVVFVIEHDEGPDGGTVGVVVNRPSRTPVGAVLSDWHDLMSEPSVLHEGGPVQTDGALCLAQLRPTVGDAAALAAIAGGPVGIRPVVGAIGVVDLDADTATVAPQVRALRVFAGHSGWSGGQLADEIADGAWYVVGSQTGDLFSGEPGSLWRDVLRRQPSPLSWVSTFPDRPEDN
jgi:putative transcriptional regulator